MPHGPIFPYPFEEHDFPNGLRLITIPAPFPDIVSLYIVVRAGSRNEIEPGKSGFAHFFEHMMFRGTPQYPPERYESILQLCGASSNAYTDDDRTVYHTTFAREDFATIVGMEADRFHHLEYSLEAFQTEALAVLGEYNKDSADPVNKLLELLRDTAFDVHSYKHTTMGFLRDIRDMPNQFEYSRLFFDRYYRPEYTTLLVVGDITPEQALREVQRQWGSWPRGSYSAAIPAEPPAQSPRKAHLCWSAATPPYLLIAYRGAAYSDTSPDGAALDLVRSLGFSENSPLYHQLVIDEQCVDLLWCHNPDRLDPFLFTVLARIKQPEQLEHVRAAILEAFRTFAENPVDAARLATVKDHLRYQFALSLNSAESIASHVASYVSLRRSPGTLNRLFTLYDSLTPTNLLTVARRYFTESGRTEVTLSR